MKTKFTINLVLALSLITTACAQVNKKESVSSPKMEVARKGSQPSRQGPAENFTGTVRVDPLFQAKESTHASGAYVTFTKGSHSAWHTHPLGQTLIVTEGVGRIQQWGGTVYEIKPGDVIWTPPGVKHWHGASPESGMTHMAVTEALNGKSVEWMEKVSAEQYQQSP